MRGRADDAYILAIFVEFTVIFKKIITYFHWCLGWIAKYDFDLFFMTYEKNGSLSANLEQKSWTNKMTYFVVNRVETKHNCIVLFDVCHRTFIVYTAFCAFEIEIKSTIDYLNDQKWLSSRWLTNHFIDFQVSILKMSIMSRCARAIWFCHVFLDFIQFFEQVCPFQFQ